MTSRWQTMEDVKNDLAYATGYAYIGPGDGVVVRDNPPPLNRENLDVDDINYWSGGLKPNEYGDVNSAYGKPDIHGINDAIRKVRGDDEDEDDDDEYPIISNKPKPKYEISKLNPNVPEFLPKGALKEKIIVNSENPIKEAKSSDSVQNGILESSKLSEEEILKTSNQLKEKIKDSSKPTFQQKKERNVAIQNLLRLYSSSPTPLKISPQLSEKTTPTPPISIASALETTPPSTKSISPIQLNSPIKLYTPDFFKNNLPSKNKENCSPVNCEETMKQNENTQDVRAVTTSNVKPETNVVETINDDFALSSRIEESTKKVTDWLTPKPKTPPTPSKISLTTPVTFKRKESSTKSKSPSVVETKISKSNVASIPYFEPNSANISSLIEKYQQNAEKMDLKEEIGNDLWHLINKELKAKDKKKKKSNSKMSNDSTEESM